MALRSWSAMTARIRSISDALKTDPTITLASNIFNTGGPRSPKRVKSSRTAIQVVSVTLYATDAPEPHWLYDESGVNLLPHIREVCRISGPLHIREVKIHETNWGGSNIAYEIPYHFDIDFGSVTSQARVVWEGKDPIGKPTNGITTSDWASGMLYLVFEYSPSTIRFRNM
ncbi:hypothetical protein BKA70DRAFT_264307 [Coprinopsis sp. MPI-PUGE-AT-0042]|nr:hypothetical protein BKA70DRAFT_264307 [Coprinopsis sp. MPI-PUGE-AT-0042]